MHRVTQSRTGTVCLPEGWHRQVLVPAGMVLHIELQFLLRGKALIINV